MTRQKTIRNEVSFKGIGLHSGIEARITVRNAPANKGVIFISKDTEIPATFDNVVDTSFATTLGRDGVTIGTVEHLLAALCGLGIDNAIIEVDGPEIPAMDGSARGFVRGLMDAGIIELDAHKRYLKVIKPVTVTDGDKSASLRPSTTLRVTYRIDFDHPMLSDQSCSARLDEDTFVKEFAPTRTFGFLREVEMMKKAGLAQGGSLENAVVLDEGTVLNKGGLRFKDELVRHKVLDAVGDLSLIGMPFIGHLVADKSGHRLNHMLIQALKSDRGAYIIMDGDRHEERAHAKPAVAPRLAEAAAG